MSAARGCCVAPVPINWLLNTLIHGAVTVYDNKQADGLLDGVNHCCTLVAKAVVRGNSE